MLIWLLIRFLGYLTAGVRLRLQTFITFCHPLLVQLNTCSQKSNCSGILSLRRWLLAVFLSSIALFVHFSTVLALIILLPICICYILDNVAYFFVSLLTKGLQLEALGSSALQRYVLKN